MSTCSELNRTEYHNQQISTWPLFWGFVSCGCVLLENLPPLCCVRAKDRSWRLHLGVEVWNSLFRYLRFWLPELGFVLGGLDFIMVAEPCGATHTIVRWRATQARFWYRPASGLLWWLASIIEAGRVVWECRRLSLAEVRQVFWLCWKISWSGFGIVGPCDLLWNLQLQDLLVVAFWVESS